MPALVLVGEQDTAYVRAGEVMAAKLPNATHVVIPDAGHVVNIEQAEAFNRAVIEFLGGLPRSDARRPAFLAEPGLPGFATRGWLAHHRAAWRGELR